MISDASGGGSGLGRHEEQSPVELVPSEGERQWEGLLDGCVAATPFHGWRWLHLLSQVQGWHFRPHIALKDGRPVGVVPLLSVRRGPVQLRARVPFPYVGPLVPPEHLVATLQAVHGWAREHRVALSRVEIAPGAAPAPVAVEATRAAGWQSRLDETFVIDLSEGSIEQFQRGMHRQAKRNVRASRSHGVGVAPATRKDMEEFLPRLLTEAYGARGLPSPYDPGLFPRLWDEWADRPDFCARTAWLGDERCGLVVTLGRGQSCYAWVGGGARDHRAAHPTAAIYVDQVAWALVRGYRRFDMVGSVDAGVSAYKRSFGAIPEPFAVISRPHGPLWAAVERGRGAALRALTRIRATRKPTMR